MVIKMGANVHGECIKLRFKSNFISVFVAGTTVFIGQIAAFSLGPKKLQ